METDKSLIFAYSGPSKGSINIKKFTDPEENLFVYFHKSDIACICISDDGKFMASASNKVKF